MEAIAFKATVKGGIIEIPEEYRGRLKDSVRVILMNEEELQQNDMIAQLLQRPLEAKSFKPLSREELHERA